MDTNKYIAWCSSLIVLIIGVMTIILNYKITSSPVREMYHNEIVTAVDSIINARFSIEEDDISIKYDSLGRIIVY